MGGGRFPTDWIFHLCHILTAHMDPNSLSPRQIKSDSDDDDLPNVTLDSVNETGSTALSIARAVQEWVIMIYLSVSLSVMNVFIDWLQTLSVFKKNLCTELFCGVAGESDRYRCVRVINLDFQGKVFIYLFCLNWVSGKTWLMASFTSHCHSKLGVHLRAFVLLLLLHIHFSA